MALSDHLNSSADAGGNMTIWLVLFGLIVAIVVAIVLFVNNKSGEATNMFNSATRDSYKKFDNAIATGEDLLSLYSIKNQGNFGLIVHTKKGSSINYGRPLVADGTAALAVTTPPAVADIKQVANVFAKDKVTGEVQEFKGSFKYEDESIRYTNAGEMNKSGSNAQILPTARYDCRLVVEGKDVIGIVAVQK